MPIVVRDPRFSMSIPLADTEMASNIRRSRPSYTQRMERRIVRVWKFVTRTTRKQPRNSFISPDFVVLTSRRSTVLYRYQK
ncbi:hypothetical protein HYPSUDRAFT_62354 [Hypholoma sublateritium FD-334 SS-4]|uniref:Uncharacterized protein n=1 Tax=Hypholoma sublateritium (strain FD-334 SS-4) TaxID=945553 RepID=A0A0D2PAM1_HYPSF|nr:hypothetical protein HYPSUDRAFT_62354 [Hypholoma sublateritium FD-334 SS-4]